MSSYALQTNDLVKAYGSRRALDGLSMHVPYGAVYGFVGLNGAGKSTLMKIASGLVRPTQGSIEVLGSDSSHSRRGVAPVGVLIEDPGLAPNLSALNNLLIKAYAMGVPSARVHCEELLELVGLDTTQGLLVKAFSLGMRQRLGIAMALVGSPRLLLLDEPLNGLDPEAAREMRTCIANLASDLGVTIVVSSHVLDQLNRVASHYGVIAHGRMVKEFSNAELQRACTRAIRVLSTDQAAAYTAIVHALPAAQVTRASDGAIEIVDPTQEPNMLAVSTALRDADVLPLGLTTSGLDIEDYFVALMEGGARDA